MQISDVLATLNLTQARLAQGAKLSRSVLGRVVTHGIWPRRDREAPRRVADFLIAQGADPGVMAQFLSAMQTAPDVQQHAGATPESQSHETLEDSMLLRHETVTPAAKKHFGLIRSPFVDDISTRADVFTSAATRYIRAALMDAALNHGFIALVGESGSGKSTLVEELEERIREEARPVIMIRPYVLSMEENDTKGRTLKSGQIAESIIRTLDPTGSPKRTPQAQFRQVHELLKASRSAGYSHVIVIEEAHSLPIATLKHLKRFLELKQGLSRLLGVCLIGQPEFKARLSEQKPEVREVVQRCELIEMFPLDEDLRPYLEHKFNRMGMKAGDVLADDAYDAIRSRLIRIPRGGKASDGISICHALVVNNLVSRAMNAAALAGWAKVDAAVIERC